MDKRKTGEMIRKARTAKGYTQTELGALLNVSNKAVSRWEIGETFPDVAVLEQLATVLGLRIGDIVTGEEGADTETALTDITREVKIQKKKRDRKISKTALLAAGTGFMLIYGLSQFAFHRASGILSWTDLPFYIMPLYLAALVFTAIRMGEMQSFFSGKRSICFGIIWIVEAVMMYSVFMIVTHIYSVGKTLFDIKPELLGTLMVSTMMIPFFISLAITVTEVILWETNYGWFIHIFDMFLAIALNGILYNMESFDGVFRAINRCTVVLLAETLVAADITWVVRRAGRNDQSRILKKSLLK